MPTSPSNADMPAPNLDVARREYGLLKKITLLAVALACATPLALNLVDPDLWGHVRYGQDWLAEGELPRTASHTFTAVDYPWINHENLAELTFAYGYRLLGTHGLLVAKCLWGMAILLTMVWVARKKQVHAFVAWALMLLVANNLQAFFPLRPQLLSFALFAVVMVLLDRAFADWQENQQVRWSALWALPFVFAVWVNAHGAFVLGLAVLGAYLGGRIVEAFIESRFAAWPKILGLSVLGITCVAATLVNPYGWGMHQWLIMSLGQPRPEISEWAAPSPTDPTFWPWILLLTTIVASLVASRKRRDWVQIAIIALVAWQSSLHLRHIAFLALLTGFWIPVHFQSALSRLRPSDKSELPVMTLSPWLRRLAVVALLIGISLQSFALNRRLSDFPVERNRYPVDALQFMVDRGLEGRLVVSFNWAQYAIAALAPEVKVAFDGRFRTCYPQEVVDMHFDFLLGEAEGYRSRSPESGPIDGTRVLKHGSPDLVLIDRQYTEAVGVMKTEALRENPEWVLLYCDRVAELWGHSSRFDDPTHADYVPLTARILDASPRRGSRQWPALPFRDQPATHLAERELSEEQASTEAEL